MNKDSKRLLDDLEFDSSSLVKHVRHTRSCLFDLPDEILLLICRYLSFYDVLYSFYTPSKPEERLHCLIFDYYTKMKLDGITNNQYKYLSKLFSDCETPLRPMSLILSNKHITCLTSYYFTSTPENVIQSIFENLNDLTLIDCSENDLQYLHINIRRPDVNEDMDYLQTCHLLINQLLFNGKISSIQTISYQIYNGLLLNKSLISNQNLRNLNLVLQTINDFYLLLNGLVPNVQTMIIKLCQQRIHSCQPHSQSTFWRCSQLIKLTLFESSLEFVIDDIRSILTYMNNLIELTLSIHDTSDPLFSHGPIFESILNEYLPHLRQFDYTMTHQIVIENFVQWPMNITFYGTIHYRSIHIYSLPWPSNKTDQRQLPVFRGGSNSSDVQTLKSIKHMIRTKDNELTLLNTKFHHVYQIITCLSIDIQFPSRISKLIFTRQTPNFSMNSIIQPSIRHLIVERYLSNENEMFILAHLFPHVKYLELSLPEDKYSFLNCLNILFHRNDHIQKKKNSYWSKLIGFSTELFSTHKDIISNENQLYNWISQYSNLKDQKGFFSGHRLFSTLTIWY